VNKSGIVWSEELFASCPSLKLILVTATGYNIIDTEAAKKFGITVCNVPGYSTNAVAQTVFAHILNFSNRIAEHNTWAKAHWATHTDWCHWLQPINDLAGKKLGIIGFGTIGQKVADIGAAFGMEVMHFSQSRTTGIDRMGNCKGLDDLLEKADFISLHCPATAQSMGLVNKDFLAKCKSSAFLVNTSRGQLIVDEDLDWALNQGLLAGAALDVLSQEPPLSTNPLIQNGKCILSPHIGWLSVESRQRAMAITVENLKKYLEENPINKVV
jgi:glycerate dehydrogenase